jgi:biopolymer transport protein ExbD
MAKREIEEINAGSMADIAFLLLIFFLVTTTMDKDQAYIRSIPKKVEVSKPVDVEKRNILAIKANNQNQLMVRDMIFEDPNKISDFVLEFYKTNEKKNDPTNNFPMYSRISMSAIDQNIAAVESEIEQMEEAGMKADVINFKYNQLDEWEKKKRALKLYGANELPEIHVQANIRIEVQQATAYSIFAKMQTEIEEAIFELRNGECERLFGMPYSVLKRRYDQDKKAEDQAMMDLLEILYPARIIEVTPKK